MPSLTCAVVALLAATAPLSLARPLDDVVKSGYLDVALYEDFRPYSWTDETGKPKGIDVDIAAELAKSLGVEVRYMIRLAGENLDADLRGNIWRGDIVDKKMADVMLHVPQDKGLMAAVPGEAEPRNDLVHFCCGYQLETFAVIADPDKIRANSFAPFVYNRIAVEVDTVPDFFLSAAFGGQLMNSVMRARTFDEAVATFERGDAAALMATKAQVEWVFANTKRKAKIMQPPTPGIVRKDWPVGLAVRTDSRDLGYAFDLELEKMAGDGRLEKIMKAYGVTYTPIPIEDH